MGLSPSALQADSMSSAQQKSEDGDAWARSSGQSRQGGRVVNTLFNQSAYSGRHEAHSQKGQQAPKQLTSAQWEYFILFGSDHKHR